MKNRCCLTRAGCVVALAMMTAAIVSWSGSQAWADDKPENVIGEVEEEDLEDIHIVSDRLPDYFMIVKDPSQHIEEAVQTFETAAAIYSVDFAPGGEEILTAGKDGAARLWDVDTGEEKAVFPITTHTEPRPLEIEDVYPSRPAAIAPDGTRVLTGFGDPPIRMWNVETGELVRTFTWGVDAATAVAFSHDGSQVLAVLACRGNSGGMRPGGMERGRFPSHVTGNIIAKAWDAESGELLQTSEEIRGQRHSRYRPYIHTLLSSSPVEHEVMVGVRLLPDFFMLDVYVRGWAIARWNPMTGEEVSRVWPSNRKARPFHGVYTSSGVPLIAEFGRSTNHLELWDAAKEERIMLWPPGTDKRVRLIDDPLVIKPGMSIYWEPPTAMDVSPCETHAVLAYGPEAPARLWNMETGELVRSFTGHEKDPSSVAFSPCGDYVLTGSWDGTARLWESGIDDE